MLRRSSHRAARNQMEHNARSHWTAQSTNGWGFSENPTHNLCRTQKDLRIDEFGEKWMMNHQQKYIKTNTEVATGDMRQVEVPLWQQKSRPTHFLSLRVPANTILQGHVESLHFITQRDMPHYAALLVPSSKIHVTLSVLTFHEEESVLLPKVQRAMSEAFRTLRGRPLQQQAKKEGELTLRFHGLGRFGQGRVVFAKVQSDYDSERLADIVSTMRKSLSKIPGVEVKGNPHDSYTPHATVAKVSDHAAKAVAAAIQKTASAEGAAGKKKLLVAGGSKLLTAVPREVYDPHANDDFGLVQFNSVDLCSMKGEGKDGHYRTVCQCPLN